MIFIAHANAMEVAQLLEIPMNMPLIRGINPMTKIISPPIPIILDAMFYTSPLSFFNKKV